MIIHQVVLVASHLTQSSLKVQYGVCNVKIVCILFIYNLYKVYDKGTKGAVLSIVDGFLCRVVDEPDFLNRVLWTDEAGFKRDGVMNLHSLHVWAEENPCPTRSSSFQHRFSVNIWAGLLTII
jgi:hypothetical protein